jgi:hypothetical protein
MNFTIQEPDNELTIGYLTMVIKYAVLLFLSWLAGWVIFLFVPVRRVSTVPIGSKLDYASVVSLFIAAVVIAYYSYQLYRKAKYGILKEIDFRDDFIELTIMNQLNGKLKEFQVDAELFAVEEDLKNHILYGEQRIYSLKEGDQMLTILNVDMTVWKRHEQLEELVGQLKKFS